jgi:hypothetical protein
MKRVHAVTRIKLAARKSDLAERAQTLKFGSLVHLTSVRRGHRDFPAKYGRLGRRCKPAAVPDVRHVTLGLVTAGNLPLAF